MRPEAGAERHDRRADRPESQQDRHDLFGQHCSWTFSAAAIYSFASADSDRGTPAGSASASYNAHMWGGVAEASYYVGIGQTRIVPKLGIDALRFETDAYTESGGTPFSVGSQTAGRVRVFATAEVGHTWLGSGQLFDLSAYGRVVEIVSQDTSTIDFAVSNLTGAVQGAVESRFGIDTGVVASYRMAPAIRLYTGYDGRYRDEFRSHGGTLGIEIRW